MGTVHTACTDLYTAVTRIEVPAKHTADNPGFDFAACLIISHQYHLLVKFQFWMPQFQKFKILLLAFPCGTMVHHSVAPGAHTVQVVISTVYSTVQ